MSHKRTLHIADWSSGVRDRENCTPAMLRDSAMMALEQAKEWADTAERLIAKADDLAAQWDGNPKGENGEAG